MLLQTLGAIILAGQDALQTACGLSVRDQQISQVAHGSLTFPAMAELEITGGPLQYLHLGCDAVLCGHLAELVEDADESGVGTLAEHMLKRLVQELDGRNVRGRVKKINVGPVTLPTRGKRSFGFRIGTDLGQLYAMAEVPSRLEYEADRGGSFLPKVRSKYLPTDWENRQELVARSTIDNMLIYMRKTEADLEITVPVGGGNTRTYNAMLIEQTRIESHRFMKVILDLSDLGGDGLPEGTPVECCLGMESRSVNFVCEYQRPSSHIVEGDAEVACALLSVPERAEIKQRRRDFRINVASTVVVEVEDLESVLDEDPWLEEQESSGVRGQLVDLSFSGARIAGIEGLSAGGLNENTLVRCRFHFPDQPLPVQLMATIRRLHLKLTENDSWEGDLGVEFVLANEKDRFALDYVREYVLAEQRAWLAKRIHVKGVEKW